MASVTRGVTTTVGVAFHSYNIGDQVYFSGVEGCDDLNGKIVTVLSVPDANTIVVNLDTRGYDAFTSDTGGITRSGPPAPPPTPPVVPPPAPAPTPPDLGGWGGRRFDFR